jgi:uncharacterized protein (TIGR02147 family)
MKSTLSLVLKQNFEQRVRTNPLYSMRSFARDLKMAPSTLSEVLKGKKGISYKKLDEIVGILRLPDWQASTLKQMAAKGYAGIDLTPEELLPTPDIKALKDDTIKALTSTLDLGILECTYLKDFEGSSSFIAKKLNHSIEDVTIAVERLKKVKLLEVNEKNEWIDLSPFFASTDGIPSEAIRYLNRSILKSIDEKIQNAPIEKRVMKSVIFSLEDSQIAEARHILDEAISKIMTLSAASTEKKDHVACFSSQLFFLSETKE